MMLKRSVKHPDAGRNGWMRGTVATPYGSITVECRRVNGKMEVQADLPYGVHRITEKN